MKKIWCQRRLFNSQYVGLCLNEKDFAAAMRYLKVRPADVPEFALSDGTTHFLSTDYGKKRAAVVCLKGWEGRDPVEIYGLLVHEAVHIWQDEMDQRREKKAGVEIEAYGIQAISQNLFEAFIVQTKRRRR